MTSEPTHEDPAKQFPGRTTPTWEIELLLSGATVFALVQFAAALPASSSYLLPRLSQMWQEILRLGLVYLQCGVILLCVAFILHLFLRAYWVALVGMDSVYPGGLKSERLRGGRVGRQWLLDNWQPMPEQIERADNRASVVFGLGIGLARMMVTITFWGTLLLATALALAAVTGQASSAQYWIIGVFLVPMAPYFLAMLLDRFLGRRLDPKGACYRYIRAMHALFAKAGLARENSPLVTLYTTNIGEDRGNWIIGGIVTAATLASAISLNVLDDELGWGNYARFPTLTSAAPQTVRHVHYASQHEAGDSPASPFLPDLQARGHYLPLVVPFVPTLHGHLIEACALPDDPGDGREAGDARRGAELACLAAGFVVTLDGEALAQAPELYSDARRDLRGLLFMVPLAGQTRGRHELVVVLTPAGTLSEDEAPPTWRIPYWY